MLVEDILNRVRPFIRDNDKIEYQDSELIGYLNDAIVYLSTILINIKDPEMVQEITVTHNQDVPLDFYSLVGIYPMNIISNKFKLNDPLTPIAIRYFAVKPSVKNLTDTIPFKDMYTSILTRLVCIYALNRNEFTITQDAEILNQELQSLITAKKSVM